MKSGKPSFHILTFGCQMNKSDSEILSGSLLSAGYVSIDDPHLSNILIFNTCAVRGNAENRAFARMREFNSLRKKKNRDQLIVVSGCVPQYEKDELLKKYPFIDIIVGANSYEYLLEILSEWNKKKGAVIKLIDDKDPEKPIKHIERDKNFDQAFLPIMYGCNNFCSYCIVPFTRGREVSRTKEDIFLSIEELLTLSYKKLLLLGQNVNSYGQGLYEDYDFADLLQDILLKFDWLEKVDFLTSHPKDITDKLIEVIAKNNKIGREIHFPIQHGDERILKLMNRGYTVQQYKEKVRKLREKVPGVRISTDLIVGFPGETEEEFTNMVNIVKELGFFRVISAVYSPRKGTKAAEMSEQVDIKIKKRRLSELNQAVKDYAFKG